MVRSEDDGRMIDDSPASEATNPRPRWRQLVRGTLAFVAITFALFLLFEGGTSFLIFLRELQTGSLPFDFDDATTVFDAEAGWTGRPDAHVEDQYGPGKHISTNGQGFRNYEDFAIEVPPGMIRLICSGDSFTLGWGVENADTWCNQLTVLVPGTETVNMGQAGYGIDQAYLWYLRDGMPLQHDMHILAFVHDDFRRMTGSVRSWAKPQLTAEDGQLRVTPPPSGVARRWLAINGQLFPKLRSVEFSQRLVRKLGGGAAPEAELTERVWPLTEAMFDDLANRHESRGSRLVLVYLPERPSPTRSESGLRSRIKDWARRRGVCFIDLIEEYGELRRNEVDTLFIHDDPYPHYNETGNRWVAERLVARLPSLSPQNPESTPSNEGDVCAA